MKNTKFGRSPTLQSLRPNDQSHKINFRLLFAILIIAVPIAGCTPPLAQPPARLIVFDVSELHLDHFALCGGPCSPDTPPPDGKSRADLLRDYDTLIFLSSLQGIVNRERPRLYLVHHPTDRFWLETYQTPNQPYGWLAQTDVVELSSLEEVLDTFAADVDGLVEWDADVPATLNVATTIAGAEGWPIVRRGSDLTAALTARWPVRQSLAGKFTDNLAAYRWAMAQYLARGGTRSTLLAYVEDGFPAQQYRQNKLTRGGVYALERDYIIQQRGFAFDLSPWFDESPNDAALLTEIVQAARREAGLKLIKVWGFIPWYEKYAADPGPGGLHSPIDGEWESTWLFSYYAGFLQGGGGDAWGAAMANVSVHQFGPPPEPVASPATPTPTELAAQGYLLPDGRINPDLTFVLFYAGDYDLVHPTQVALAGWWRSTWVQAGRGKIPLAWGINPGMEEEIPAIMTYMLATRTTQDYLVAANSGAGYVNPQGLSRRYRQQWLNRSGDYYQKYGLTVQGFLLNGRGYSLPPEWAQRFTAIAPAGIVSPDFEIEGDWPRLLDGGTPYTGMVRQTLGDSVAGSAANLHAAYRQTLADGRDPFIVIRSSFQTPAFLADVIATAQAQDAAGEVFSDDGAIIHPRYTLVDPATFFALLKIDLQN